MSRFEYNFTRESEFEELKERNQELEEENTLLKQSLEELIKVNTELTESIEELNNGNFNQNSEDIENRFEMLINENHNLREQLEQETERTKAQKRSAPPPPDDDQTESLVSVLEELIESFKNIELKYESEINQLQQTLEATRSDLEDKLKKLHQQLDSKINTIEALTIQLKRKDEILENISTKFSKIEQEAQQRPNMFKSNNRVSDNQGEIKALEKKIETINKNLEEKNKVIQVYEDLLLSLKGKIMEKC